MDFHTRVGERVGIVRYNRTYGGLQNSGYGTVTKINGHGHIYVKTDTGQERRFDRRGEAYKDSYGPMLISADKLAAQLAAQAVERNRNTIAQDIQSTLKGGFTYSGRFVASAERVAKLRELVAQLELVVEAD